MTRALSTRALAAFAIGVAMPGVVVIGCKVHVGGKLSASADVTIESTGGYAAMEEIPVAGGELRLAVPQPMPDGSGDQIIAFPLRHTAIHADVAGMLAVYTVEQVFENPFDEPIEAVYVFPLGDEAAVSGYAITIGERTVIGEIKERDAARATYEQARADGHTAGLIEQEKPNVFAQHLANIAPHETIKVRIEYSELLDYLDGEYTIVAPLTVGPRYLPAEGVGKKPVGSKHAGTAGRPGVLDIPYVEAEIAGSTVSFTADVDAGVPILGVTSPSHDLDVEVVTATRSTNALTNTGELPNRDLVVRFGTASAQTMVGVLSHRVDDDGYFVLVVQPKAEYRTGDITPREVILLIDTSGSMDGLPLRQAKDVAGAILDTLGNQDTFDIVSFSGAVSLMSETPIAGDRAGREAGHAYLDGLQSGGGTEMTAGMLAALATAPGNDRVRIVYMLSDGYVGNDDVVLNAAKGALGVNRVFPVGIGEAPNRALMDQLAVVGRGFSSYLALDESAGDLTPSLVRRSAYPYLTDVEIDWGGLAVADVTPEAIPDVYAGQPLILSGRYTKPGKATIEVTANTAGRRVSIPLEVALPTSTTLEPVADLWARRRVDALLATAGPDGPDARVVKGVTDLGLRFAIVTDYTSFVAVDRSRVVVPGGASKVVEQPAAVPEGVNLDTAVGDDGGGSSSYTPSSSGYSSGGGGGGGGDWGGGDADPLTLLLALALLPLAVTLRRARAA